MPTIVHDPDAVELYVVGEKVLTAKSYNVDLAFFNQPAAFAIDLGDDTSARTYREWFKPRQPFALKVAGRFVSSGLLDELDIEGPPTRVKIAGRDYMQLLQDAFIEQERTFDGVTYAQLVRAGLDAVGLTDAKLVYDNDANRNAISGGKGTPFTKAVNVAEDKIESSTGGKVHRKPQAKLGEKWADFLRRHLDRAGLFLWTAGALDFSTSAPTFVLSRPNGEQKARYRIVNNRASDKASRPSNVLTYSFKDDTKGRFSEVRIYTRGSTKAFKRGKVKGSFEDEEMVALGYKRPLVIRDAECSNEKQAEFMARRRIAESRRNGGTLQYTVQGHTAPSLDGKSTLVWTPDTVVSVEDDELGIKGDYWIDTVHFSRGTHTTTSLTLQRPEDLVYGEP